MEDGWTGWWWWWGGSERKERLTALLTPVKIDGDSSGQTCRKRTVGGGHMRSHVITHVKQQRDEQGGGSHSADFLPPQEVQGLWMRAPPGSAWFTKLANMAKDRRKRSKACSWRPGTDGWGWEDEGKVPPQMSSTFINRAPGRGVDVQNGRTGTERKRAGVYCGRWQADLWWWEACRTGPARPSPSLGSSGLQSSSRCAAPHRLDRDSRQVSVSSSVWGGPLMGASTCTRLT